MVHISNIDLSGVNVSPRISSVKVGNIPSALPAVFDPNAGLLAAWNFIGSNYSDTDVVPDATGNGLDFTIVNSPHNYAGGWDRDLGLRFDKAGMYIYTPNFVLGRDFTIILFANVYGNSGTARSGFCKKDVLYSAFASGNYLKLETAYIANFSRVYSSTVKAITSQSYVIDDNTYVSAKNGVYKKEEPAGGLTYGRDEAANLFCGGRLFAVRLYNTILSESDINEAYNTMLEDFKGLLLKDWVVTPNSAGRPANTASDLGLTYNAIDVNSQRRFLFAADASYILSSDHPCFNATYVDFDFTITINQNQTIGRYYDIVKFGTLSAPPATTGNQLSTVWQIHLVGRSTWGICLRFNDGRNWNSYGDSGQEVYLKNDKNQDYTIKIERRRDTLRGYVNGVLFWDFDVTGWVPKAQGNRLLIGRAVGGADTFRGTVSNLQYKVVGVHF